MKTLKCFMLILVFVAYGSICFCDYTCNDEITLTLKQKGNIITCKGKKVSIPVDFDLKANNPVLQEQLLPAKLIQTVYFELITPTPSERKSIESVIIDDVLFDKSNSFKHNEGTFIIEFITEANKSGNTVKITQISHPPSICNNCPTATEPLNSLLGNIKIQFTPKSTRVHYLSIAIKPNEKFKLCVPQEQNNNKCYECSGETIIMINPVELKDIKFENMQDANPAICIGITAEMHAIVEPQAYSNDVKWESDGFAAIGRAFSINWLTSGRKKIHATLYGCELDKFADAVEIDTLTADNKIACKDTAIKFNVTTKPPNHEDLISWEISDAERSRSHRIGKTVISVMWSVLGPQYATATCGTSKISEYVELCGIDLIAESNELFIDYDIVID